MRRIVFSIAVLGLFAARLRDYASHTRRAASARGREQRQRCRLYYWHHHYWHYGFDPTAYKWDLLPR